MGLKVEPVIKVHAIPARSRRPDVLAPNVSKSFNHQPLRPASPESNCIRFFRLFCHDGDRDCGRDETDAFLHIHIDKVS